METHLRSTDLALNIPRSHEAAAICTIFLDTMEVNIEVQQTQVIMGRNSLVTDVYPMTSGKPFVDTLENIISDEQIEIPKKVTDVLS